jgi:hypothetical protein
VALSIALSAFWAVWGTIESFHEGWYFREAWRNVALMLVQYLPWMFVPMTAGLLALWRWPAGLVAHGALAAGALWLFGLRSVGGGLIALPVLVLGLLYSYGRPQPLAWARRVLVLVPLLTGAASGAYPAWRVFTRPSVVDVSMRAIEGDGVDLVWAPAGPGWDDRGFSWFEAARRCAYLTADGTALADAPQSFWRLPTVDEVVRTQRWRGANAGGVWDAAAGRASYRTMPDKEAPLWHPYSQVIYWWTASDAGGGRAYRVAYNGYVLAVRKQHGADYTACRCVRTPTAPSRFRL